MSGITFVTSFTSKFVMGSTIITVVRLNTVWNMASWVCGAEGKIFSNTYPKFVPPRCINSPINRNTTTPHTLKII